MKIELFVPCFVDQLYPETAFNAIKVLEYYGCEVIYNPNQTCCGQPAFNSGHFNEAREVAEKFVKSDFTSNHKIVVLSSSCTGMIRNFYSEFFHNSSQHNQYKAIQKNTFEFTEFLNDILKVDTSNLEFEGKITYHDACSALRECNVTDAPRNILNPIKNLELCELEDNRVCCGFGGTFAAKYEPISVGMADQKVNKVVDTNANILVSSDLSCLLHLDAFIKKKNLPIKSMHIADLLAKAIEKK